MPADPRKSDSGTTAACVASRLTVVPLVAAVARAAAVLLVVGVRAGVTLRAVVFFAAVFFPVPFMLRG